MPMTINTPNPNKNNRQKVSSLKTFAIALVTGLSLVACQPTKDEGETSPEAAAPTNSENSSSSNIDQRQNDSIETVSRETVVKLANPVSQPIEQPITILALGDSLTEGLGMGVADNYPAQLQRALKDAGYVNTKVVNSGLSGETSTGLVNRLDWVLRTKPDITILTTGANDAMRGIDVATVDKNIRTAIKRLQDNGSIVILGGMEIYDNMGDEYVQAFSNLYPQIVEDTGVHYIPFFLEGVAGVSELNQSDGIHPTAEGYARIVNDNILPVLEPTLQEYVTDDTTEAVQ